MFKVKKNKIEAVDLLCGVVCHTFGVQKVQIGTALLVVESKLSIE